LRMDMEGRNGKGRRTRAFCAVRSRLPAYKRGPPAAIDTGGVTQTGTGEVARSARSTAQIVLEYTRMMMCRKSAMSLRFKSC
jgi:hypothetical protein